MEHAGGCCRLSRRRRQRFREVRVRRGSCVRHRGVRAWSRGLGGVSVRSGGPPAGLLAELRKEVRSAFVRVFPKTLSEPTQLRPELGAHGGAVPLEDRPTAPASPLAHESSCTTKSSSRRRSMPVDAEAHPRARDRSVARSRAWPSAMLVARVGRDCAERQALTRLCQNLVCSWARRPAQRDGRMRASGRDAGRSRRSIIENSCLHAALGRWTAAVRVSPDILRSDPRLLCSPR